MKTAILNAAREPSTWAGVGAVVTSAAQAWATKDPQAIAATVAGVLAIFLREKGGQR